MTIMIRWCREGGRHWDHLALYLSLIVTSCLTWLSISFFFFCLFSVSLFCLFSVSLMSIVVKVVLESIRVSLCLSLTVSCQVCMPSSHGKKLSLSRDMSLSFLLLMMMIMMTTWCWWWGEKRMGVCHVKTWESSYPHKKHTCLARKWRAKKVTAGQTKEFKNGNEWSHTKNASN